MDDILHLIPYMGYSTKIELYLHFYTAKYNTPHHSRLDYNKGYYIL